MKIFCIGRNYIDHAKELKNEIPSSPVVFMKPPTALLKNNQNFYLPDFSKDIHFELELVLKINKNGKHIDEKFAYKYYDQIALGIDFTARDLQRELKSKGLPWELSKGFDHSALIGEFVALNNLEKNNIKFQLKKNNETLQNGNSKDMIFTFDKIISYISKYFTLQKGDLIYTGTPAGVGAVKIGDCLTGILEGNENFNIMVK